MIEIGIFGDETDQNMITDLVDTYMKEKKVPYIIYTYKTGKQLLESGKMFHIVFLNIAMGKGMDGIIIGQQVYSVDKRTKIIYLTINEQVRDFA